MVMTRSAYRFASRFPRLTLKRRVGDPDLFKRMPQIVYDFGYFAQLQIIMKIEPCFEKYALVVKLPQMNMVDALDRGELLYRLHYRIDRDV